MAFARDVTRPSSAGKRQQNKSLISSCLRNNLLHKSNMYSAEPFHKCLIQLKYHNLIVIVSIVAFVGIKLKNDVEILVYFK
jgi:hypothetical protein